MVQYADQCRTLGIRYIFDPGQQCARMSGDELREGVVGATVVICNDYEFALLKQKTGLTEADILKRSEALIVTRGEHGSSVTTAAGTIGVPAVAPSRIVDPTGVGDAFRGGLMKGIAMGLSYQASAQVGTVAATVRARGSRSEPRVFVGGIPAAGTSGTSRRSTCRPSSLASFCRETHK